MIVISNNETFTTTKYHAVEWPKMHKFQNGIHTFFEGGGGEYTPVSLYLVHGALRFGLPSPLIEIYVTIRLGINVSEN